MPRESPDAGLDPLAQKLSSLVPSTGSLDRDRVLYCAGQASKSGSVNLWRIGTLAALLAGVAVFVADRAGPAPQPAEKLVYVWVEVPAKSAEGSAVRESLLAMATEPAAQTDIWDDNPYCAYRLEQTVLRSGFEGLPKSTVSVPQGPVLSVQDWRQGRYSNLLNP